MSGIKIPANNTATLPAAFHKTTGVPLNEKSSQSVQGGKFPVQTQPALAKAAPVTSAGEQTVSARALFMETAAALGFPKNTLSASLLAFARFFSLSPALLGSLRRDFLNANKTVPALMNQGNEAAQGKEKAGLEARALATAAAFDKGVTLSSEAHAHYTRYLTPPEPPAGQKTGNDTFAGTGGGKNKNNNEEEEPPTPEKVKAIAEEESGKDNLLDLLNTLPGKNGQHWAIFPFNIQVRGIELKVFVRILKREPLFSRESALMIADVSGQKRQWRCFLRVKAGKVLADLRVYPSVSERTLNRLTKEAERFLCADYGSALNFGGFGEILVGNRDESPSWMDDLCAESLLSVNSDV